MTDAERDRVQRIWERVRAQLKVTRDSDVEPAVRDLVARVERARAELAERGR